MRVGFAKIVGVSLLCALACGCGGGEGEGSGVENGGGSAGQGGGGTSSVGGLAMGGGGSDGGGSTNQAGKANQGGSTNLGGSDAGGGGSGGGGPACMDLSNAEQMMLFEQAPHCTMTFDYQLEGSIDGGMVHDIRDDGFSGGYINGSNAKFETPSAGSTDPTRVKIRFNWTRTLAHGDSCTTVNGIVIPPTGNPRAGEELCITQGAVGFVEGGADDGNFKFHLYGARVGADCAGEEVPIDLRGCM